MLCNVQVLRSQVHCHRHQCHHQCNRRRRYHNYQHSRVALLEGQGFRSRSSSIAATAALWNRLRSSQRWAALATGSAPAAASTGRESPWPAGPKNTNALVPRLARSGRPTPHRTCTMSCLPAPSHATADHNKARNAMPYQPSRDVTS